MEVQPEDQQNFGGRKLLQDGEHFPQQRGFKDPIFAVLFYVVAAGVMYFGFSAVAVANESVRSPEMQSLGPIVGWVAAGAVTSFAASFLLILLLRAAPSLLVWVSLLVAPVLLLLGAAWCFLNYQSMGADMEINFQMYGGLLLLFAIIKLLIIMCWRKYVPMTALVLSTVSHVLIHKLNIIIVALLASALSLVWAVLSIAALVGVQANTGSDGSNPLAMFAFFVIFCWGMLVFRNVGYFSYCSVFAQWYYGRRLTTTGSVCTALTTSFGSICFGSLLVAIVRALRYMAEEAKRSNNGATKIIGFVIVCLLQCIEDIVEWFASIVYVQCAVRGLSFCDGARATCALATSGNIGKICSQLLAGSVTAFGSFVSGLMGLGVTYAVANGGVSNLNIDQDSQGTILTITCLMGFPIFFFIGYTLFGVVMAGVNTILVCWAETPVRLAETHAEVHNRFTSLTGVGGDSSGAGVYPGAPPEGAQAPQDVYAAQAGVQPQVMHPSQPPHVYA